MELLIFWRILRRWWWLGLIPVLIAAAFTLPQLLNRQTVSGGFARSITYSAAQSMDAIPRTEGDYQDIWLSSELTVNAFTEWIRGSRFKDEVVALASQTLPVESAQFGIAADNARSVGRIDLGYPSAEGLEAISAAVVEVLSTRSEAYFAQLGGQPAAVTLLGETPIAAAPPPLTDRFSPLVRLALGAAAGLLLMVLAHFLDPFVHTRSELNEIGHPCDRGHPAAVIPSISRAVARLSRGGTTHPRPRRRSSARTK
ncbi:MAG: hypothetical protein IPK19_04440 [Chloroflexi bacterium]|nr:hypothetical protein [Chloroflexota bacterium]